MKELVLNIPDELELDKQEASMLLASQLYELGKLSLGQAADVAGLTKRAFIELLGRYNISIFNFPAGDLANDVANA
jgi:predicted HTH domain antitoxin